MITTTKPPKRDRTSPVDLQQHVGYVTAMLEEARACGLFQEYTYGVYYYAGPFHSWQYQKSSQSGDYHFFDVASVTKTIPTSLLILRLIDEGDICKETLDDPIRRYLPEFQGPWTEDVTIRHILSFAIQLKVELGEGVGEERIKSLLRLGVDGIHRRIMSSGLSRAPGRFAYHNSTSYIAARLIEKLYGMSYEEAADKFILKQLDLEGGFLSGKLPLHLVSPTEIQNGKTVHGIVHDEFSRALEIAGGPKSGSAGMFLNGNDGMKILRAFCSPNSKVLQSLFGRIPERLPSKFAPYGLLGQMRTNQLFDPEHIYGLGWDILDRNYGDCACGPESTLLITGFTGCVIVVQPTMNRGFFLFSNATFPHRRPKVGGRSPLYELRRNIFLSLQSCNCNC